MVKRLKRPAPNPRQAQTQIYPLSSGVILAGMKKGPGHPCDAACRRAGHRYKHEFSSDVAVIGNSDGSVTLRTRGTPKRYASVTETVPDTETEEDSEEIRN